MKKKSKLVIKFRLKEVYLLKFQRQTFVASDTSFTKLEYYIFNFTPKIVITDYFCCVSRKSIPIYSGFRPNKRTANFARSLSDKILILPFAFKETVYRVHLF